MQARQHRQGGPPASRQLLPSNCPAQPHAHGHSKVSQPDIPSCEGTKPMNLHQLCSAGGLISDTCSLLSAKIQVARLTVQDSTGSHMLLYCTTNSMPNLHVFPIPASCLFYTNDMVYRLPRPDCLCCLTSSSIWMHDSSAELPLAAAHCNNLQRDMR